MAALPFSTSAMPASVASGVPQTNGALQTLNHCGSPIVALRKSSWAKATNTAWRILALSNGLAVLLKRKVYWLPVGLKFTSLMFLSLASSGSRSWPGDSIMSISPFWRAATWVWMSGIAIHSTRSTLTTLPPARPDGGLGARLVLGVLDVDDLLARLPFVGLEDERAGADHVLDLDLLHRVGFGRLLRHHERHVRRRLAERLQHQAVRLLHLHLEGLGVDDLEALDRAHHLLAHRIAGGPALDRGDAILGGDRLAVVPFEAVAQREGPGELVGRDVVLVDHLRLHVELLVHGEQRVPHHVAVVALDVGGGPDRIEDLHVRMHDDLEGLRLHRAGSAQQAADACGRHAVPTTDFLKSNIVSTRLPIAAVRLARIEPLAGTVAARGPPLTSRFRMLRTL